MLRTSHIGDVIYIRSIQQATTVGARFREELQACRATKTGDYVTAYVLCASRVLACI